MKINSEFYFSIVPEWLTESDVSDNAFRVYATLCRYADKDDGSCYPSIKHLGDRCNKSVSSVKRALKELKDLGAIKIQPRYIEEKGQTSNLYTVIYNPFNIELGSQSKSELGASSNVDYKPKKNNQSHSMSAYSGDSREDLYSVLIEELGYQPSTKVERSGFNKVLKELDQAHATTDQIRDRIRIYKKEWKGVTLTHFALIKHWSMLGSMAEENKPAKIHNCKEDGHDYIDLDQIYFCRFCKTEKSKD